ncbi:hypothetical protein ACSMXN_14310 [Jatrophihabitans sp. DSM 45814]
MNKYGLSIGSPDLKSVGAITFGPAGILFVADNMTAAVFAIDVDDKGAVGPTKSLDVEHLDSRLASYLGTDTSDVTVRGMAVHPTSQAVYLSVMRGRGVTGVPVLLRVDSAGELTEVSTVDVPFAEYAIGDAPTEEDSRQDVQLDGSSDESQEVEFNGVRLNIARTALRTSTITDMAWIDGTLIVAGASNEEFSSALRRIPFPFSGDAQTNALEIFHVSHGKYETSSPIRTFIPFDGNTSVLASYTCTPIVYFSLTDLQSGNKAAGRTVAELGAMNQPLDMVSYQRDGEEFLLVSNTRHPLLKIPAGSIEGQEALTQPTEPVGVPREELPHQGVSWMANLNGSYVVMMQRDEAGELHLRSYSTASL